MNQMVSIHSHEAKLHKIRLKLCLGPGVKRTTKNSISFYLGSSTRLSTREIYITKTST